MALAVSRGVRGNLMRPNRGIVSAYVTRHLRLWAVLRLGLSGLFLLAGTDPLRVTPLTGAAILVACAAVSVVEMRLRREWDLLGNLSVGHGALALLVCTPPLVGELAVRALGSLRS